MRISSQYKATIMSLDDSIVGDCKKLAKILNLQEKTEEIMERVKPIACSWSKRKFVKRYRLVIRGRLGKKSPHAHLYAKGGKHWKWSSMDIRNEHASRFDLYIQQYLQEVKR